MKEGNQTLPLWSPDCEEYKKEPVETYFYHSIKGLSKTIDIKTTLVDCSGST